MHPLNPVSLHEVCSRWLWLWPTCSECSWRQTVWELKKKKRKDKDDNQHFTSVQIPSGSSYWPCVSPVVMTVVKIRADKQSKHSMSIQQTGEVLSFPFVSLTQACICGQSPGESADLPRVLWAPQTLKLCQFTASTNESAQTLRDNDKNIFYICFQINRKNALSLIYIFDTNAYGSVVTCSHHGQINHPLLYCKQLPSTHKPDYYSKGMKNYLTH